VQISVIVAIIQTKYNTYKGWTILRLLYVREALKIVVGKVFLRVALMQELVGPKYKGNTVKVYRTKGNQVNIPELRA
jgi:hypothetical protein